MIKLPVLLFSARALGCAAAAQAADPLQSWNDTAQKKAFIAFVERDQGRLDGFCAGARAMKSNTV